MSFACLYRRLFSDENGAQRSEEPRILGNVRVENEEVMTTFVLLIFSVNS